jgi:putative tryptophan/tyrosine transport system substrate-binding protein
MRRREFITLLGGAAATPLLSLRTSRAQQPRKVPRIGVLLPGTAASFALRTKAFLEGLRDLGYVDGQTIAIEWKWGQDRVEGFPELAAELVGHNVDVIITGGTPAAKALKSATATIPIVMAIIGDPVAAGLVESLARPGGNATGFSIVAPDLSGKRLELLKEIVAEASPVAVMLNTKNPQSQFELNEMQAAARTMGLQLRPIQISPEDTLEEAFAAMSRASARALIILTDPIFFSQRKRIVDLAARSRLPAMHFFQEFTEEGGLVSYGPSDTDLYRRSATYVDRILNGAKPSELPVEQPTKFELVINLKAAKALGLDISPLLLARADKVIE